MYAAFILVFLHFVDPRHYFCVCAFAFVGFLICLSSCYSQQALLCNGIKDKGQVLKLHGPPDIRHKDFYNPPY